MNHPVLEEFLLEEAIPDVRALILQTVNKERSSEAKRSFEFNRFDLTLDFAAGDVCIEDVLDPSQAGECRIPLDYFVQRLCGE